MWDCKSFFAGLTYRGRWADGMGGVIPLRGVVREGCGGRLQGGAQRSGARERSAPRSSPTPRG
ncbi:hypothetical protein, partial [Schleiferia thermophila]